MDGGEDSVGVDGGTDLTAATVVDLRAAVAAAVRPGRTVELHLESVTSYDAAGLGLLFALTQRIDAADGHLVCVSPSRPLSAGIQKLGLERVLHLRTDVPEQKTGNGEGSAQDAGGRRRRGQRR